MELDLTPKLAQPMFEGDGGGYYTWSSSQMPVLAATNVGAGRLLLHPRGFALPHYADSSKIGYVIQGKISLLLHQVLLKQKSPKKYCIKFIVTNCIIYFLMPNILNYTKFFTTNKSRQ